ncbi:MAG TPA: hypothetical protein VFK03_02925 [Candidatus Saccharimonadales bacterium]|nr:hypothetical protein [Candidatus Saccharimonadales bacterium]
MAGFYPDPIDNRFAYHLDGTKIYTLDVNDTLVDVTSIGPILNDEDSDGSGAINGKSCLIFLFPEKRTLSGYYVDGYYTPGTLQVSSDTTTLLDGTWTTVANPWIMSNDGDPTPEYRQKINSVTAGSVKALKFSNSDVRYMYTLHLYGSIPFTENVDRLIFWDSSLDQPTGGAYFDFGDVTQGQSYTKQFRVKNNSSTKTANSVNLSTGNETYDMALQFSTDNVTYSPTLDIGNLAAGATSSVIYAQRAVPPTEGLQAHACRLKASAASWT